jgi:hypothetical protein
MHLERAHVQIGAGTVRRELDGTLHFLERRLGVIESGVGICQQNTRVHAVRLFVEHGAGDILRVCELLRRQQQIAEGDLRLQIVGLLAHRPVEFAIGLVPHAQLEITLRKLIVRLFVVGVDFDRVLVLDDRRAVALLRKIFVAAREEFPLLYVGIARAGADREHKQNSASQPCAASPAMARMFRPGMEPAVRLRNAQICWSIHDHLNPRTYFTAKGPRVNRAGQKMIHLSSCRRSRQRYGPDPLPPPESRLSIRIPEPTFDGNRPPGDRDRKRGLAPWQRVRRRATSCRLPSGELRREVPIRAGALRSLP